MMKLTSRGRPVATPDSNPPVQPKAESPPEPEAKLAAPPAPSAKPSAGKKPETSAGQPDPVAKINWNEIPEIEVVTAADVERAKIETEARRKREMIGMFKIGGYCLLGLVVLALAFESVRYVLNKVPAPEKLASLGSEVGVQVLHRFTTGQQPLEVESVESELLDRSRSSAQYEYRVTLRLRGNLYGPADSNGAQPYLQMRRSLADAEALVLQKRLFLDTPDVAQAPEMPMLIAVTHRAGERMIVRVPLEATRSVWSWRLRPDVDRARVSGRRFEGQAISRYHDTPHLIFGTVETRERMRELMSAARKFILEVNAENVRRRAAGL